MKHLPMGLTIKGLVVSSRASAYQRKDGSGLVIVAEHEIAAPPLLVCVEQYLDLVADAVELDGLSVKSFPQWKTFEEVALRVEKLRMRGDVMVVTRYQREPETEVAP